MPHINVLDISVANLIAAGEVVERPASVVKELLENAVDAGASTIVVEIKRGGISFIRVADNGCGMAREDVPVALKRHATSKIHDASDLASIMTLGFRGEALAAISSVARVRIITRIKDENTGTLLESDPDGDVSVSDTGAPTGTTVIVEELFANVPARLKFLKKDAGEGMAVTAIVEKLALSRPDISIRYISDGAVKFETAGTGKLDDAIYAVLGRDFAKRLVAVDELTEGIAVSGFVGAPESARGNRNYENMFINGRYIKSLTVSTAVEQAFESYIPGDRFPVCVLNLGVHPTLVDVNVHPTKLEVKFSNERAVFEAVYCAVRNALSNKLPRVKLETPQVKLTGDDLAAVAEAITGRLDQNERDGDITHDAVPAELTAQSIVSTTSAQPVTTKTAPVQNTVPHTEQKPVPAIIRPAPEHSFVFDTDESEPEPIRKPQAASTQTSFTEPIRVEEPIKAPAPQSELIAADTDKPRIYTHVELDPETPFRVAGILFNCYIIVETGERVVIIDKHAAHERCLFEDMKKRMRADSGAHSQLLFIPIEIMLSPEERGALGEFSEEFDALGFGCAELDGGKIGLVQVPSDLSPEAAAALFSSLASSLAEGSSTPRSERDALYERALYTASCKAAMKAGRDDGGLASLNWLVKRVLTEPAIRVCPHGRPVAVETDKSGFEKIFWRT